MACIGKDTYLPPQVIQQASQEEFLSRKYIRCISLVHPMADELLERRFVRFHARSFDVSEHDHYVRDSTWRKTSHATTRILLMYGIQSEESIEIHSKY